MKLEDIQALWNIDCKIDYSRLDFEALRISELHNKYYPVYMRERVRWRKLKEEAKQLRFDKREFYLFGENEESRKLGWELPPKGKILKPEVGEYLDVDKDIVAMNLRIGVQEEKIDFLKSILDTISKRSFQIREANQFLSFVNGK